MMSLGTDHRSTSGRESNTSNCWEGDIVVDRFGWWPLSTSGYKPSIIREEKSLGKDIALKMCNTAWNWGGIKLNAAAQSTYTRVRPHCLVEKVIISTSQRVVRINSPSATFRNGNLPLWSLSAKSWDEIKGWSGSSLPCSGNVARSI